MLNGFMTIDGFEIHETLGSDAMSTDYRGVQLSVSRPVLLKLIHPHLTEDPLLVARFIDEIRAAAQLHHGNVVGVIECVHIDSTLLVALELVEGHPLQWFLSSFGPPATEIVVALARGMLRALQHAHEHGRYHFHIDPTTVTLTPDGGIKIISIGLAHIVGVSPPRSTTHTSIDASTFLAPEQLAGHPVDARTDIYFLGVLLYQLLSGQLPFHDTPPPESGAELSLHDPDPLEAVAPRVPAGLAAMVHRMLRTDADQRYQSAAEVRQALEELSTQARLRHGDALLRPYALDPMRFSGRRRQPAVVATEALAPSTPAAPETDVLPVAPVSAHSAPSRPCHPAVPLWVRIEPFVVIIFAAALSLAGGHGPSILLPSVGSMTAEFGPTREAASHFSTAGSGSLRADRYARSSEASSPEDPLAVDGFVGSVPLRSESVQADSSTLRTTLTTASAAHRKEMARPSPKRFGVTIVVLNGEGTRGLVCTVSVNRVPRGETPTPIVLPRGKYTFAPWRRGFSIQPTTITMEVRRDTTLTFYGTQD